MNLVNQSIIKHEVGLLNLAEELKNVSQACRKDTERPVLAVFRRLTCGGRLI